MLSTRPHGTNDPRCPIARARIVRDTILELGKREGTGPSGDLADNIRTDNLVAAFLQRRL